MSYKSELPVFGIYRCMIDPAWQNQLHELVEAAIDAHANFESQSQLSLPISGLAFSVARKDLATLRNFMCRALRIGRDGGSIRSSGIVVGLGVRCAKVFAKEEGPITIERPWTSPLLMLKYAIDLLPVGVSSATDAPVSTQDEEWITPVEARGLAATMGVRYPLNTMGNHRKNGKFLSRPGGGRLQLRDRTRFVWPMASLAK